jgi:hypothetical protein
MADWRQIQARIRKARTSSDPPAQLADLYQRTRDAMVAFELAQWHEKAGNASETVQWYTTAAQRFRRAQWRTKAEEALTRLGAPSPEPSTAPAAEHASEAGSAFAAGAAHELSEESPAVPSRMAYESSLAETEAVHGGNGHPPAETAGTAGEESADEGKQPAAADASATGRRRRRGRRGGRKRRGRVGEGAGQSQAAVADKPLPGRQPSAVSSGAAAERPTSIFERPESPTHSLESTEPYARPVGGLLSSRPRAGDPGLSSRIAQLESQLRRLLACPLASLEDADQAPAGPGVLLLSDSDQVTHYYVEACQTLRIGIGNLLRGGRGSKGAAQLKPSLAEHLGISESRVAKYMKDHCAVRWLQLDEGAPSLANFATAVLRPVVAE